MAKKKAAKPTLYSWDGGKKVHSISQATHNQDVEARGYGLDLNANPLARPAFAQAAGQAAAEYGPQIRAAQGVQAALPSYVADYLARNGVAGAQQQQYAAPILAQASAWANQAPQAAPGLDPSSAAYGQSKQAATSGQSLAKLGADTVAAIPLASQAYLAGQADLAARQVAPAQAAYGQQVAGLKSDQAAKTAGYYGTNIQNAQNADLAYKTLTGNQANMAADNAYQVASAQQQAADKKAARVVSRKNTRDRITAQTEKTQATADKQAAKDKAAADKVAAKKHAAVQKATGAVKSQVTDIIDAYNSGGTIDDTTKPADPVTGKYPQRKATPAEMRALLISKNGYLARIALAIKAGKKLDQKAIDYLKQKHPDFRVPREWLPSKTTAAQDKNPHGTGRAPDKAPGGRGHI